MATVHVSNIAQTTSEKEVKDFFSFCGKITDISVTPASSEPDSTLSATVTFERESAAKTALLLDNTQLGATAVHVQSASSLDDLSKTAAEDAHDEDLRQEDKPRIAVLAEYLSHGYVIGDKALQKGIELDEKHGITNKFNSYLANLDNKIKATDKARAVDNTYNVTTRANTGLNTVTRYFESALNTPTGQKVRAFYTKGSKQVLDIHTEARRLADLRLEKSKCVCGGETGSCTCRELSPRQSTYPNTNTSTYYPIGEESDGAHEGGYSYRRSLRRKYQRAVSHVLLTLYNAAEGKCTCAGCAKDGPSTSEKVPEVPPAVASTSGPSEKTA